MKNIFMILLITLFCFGGESVTDSFQIRNLSTGIPINLNRSSKIFNYQNWFLNDLGVDEKVAKIDKLSKQFPYGYVQFKVVSDPNKCLSIAPSGFLALKDCKSDYESGEFESIWQLIPTNFGALQIRSLVLNTNECLGIFSNPNVNILDSVGLVDCIIDDIFSVDIAQLFVLTPQLSSAVVIK